MYAQDQSLCYVIKKQLWNYSSSSWVFPYAVTRLTSQSEVLMCSLSTNVRPILSCWVFHVAYCVSSEEENDAFAMFVHEIKYKSNRLVEERRGQSPPFLYEVIFLNRPKTLRKVWGNTVTEKIYVSCAKRGSVFCKIVPKSCYEGIVPPPPPVNYAATSLSINQIPKCSKQERITCS